MDNALKKLITETIDRYFEDAPAKMIEKGNRTVTYDVCPHCKKEIYEKHEYTEDGGKTWRHSDCRGLIERPEEPLENFPEWLRSSIQQVRDERKK